MTGFRSALAGALMAVLGAVPVAAGTGAAPEALIEEGQAARAAGDFAAAQTALEAALALLQDRPRTDDQRFATESAYSEVLFLLGDYETGLAFASARADAILQETGPDDLRHAETLSDRAAFLQALTRHAEAAPLVRQIHENFTANAPETNRRRAIATNNRAMLESAEGNLELAESLFRESLRLRRLLDPPSPAEVVLAIKNLAAMLDEQGRYGEAAALHEEALSLYDALGADQAQQRAISLANAGSNAYRRGALRLGIERTREAMRIIEMLAGPGHMAVGALSANLGQMLIDAGEVAAARPLLERALAIRTAAAGARSAPAARSLQALAVLESAEQRTPQALAYAQRALAIFEEALGPDHHETAFAVLSVADLTAVLGDLAAARPMAERALAIREAGLPAGHPEIASALMVLGEIAERQGDIAGASRFFSRALAIREDAFDATQLDLIDSRGEYGWLLASLRGEIDQGYDLISAATIALERRADESALSLPDTAADDLATRRRIFVMQVEAAWSAATGEPILLPDTQETLP